MRVAWRQHLAFPRASRGGLAVVGGLLAVAGVWAHAAFVDPVYEAVARVRIEALDGAPVPDGLARYHRDLALSPVVLARASGAAQGAALDAVRARLTVMAEGGSALAIAARAPDGAGAAALADATAGAFVAHHAPGADALAALRRRRDVAEERLAAARERPRPPEAGDATASPSRALAEASARVEAAARRAEILEREAALSADAVALSRNLAEPALDGVLMRYRESAKALEDLGVTLGPRHPALLEADQRRRAAERLLRAEIRRVVQAAAEDLAAARAAERRAREALDRARGAAKTGAIEPATDPAPHLAPLERDAAAALAAYEAALAQGAGTMARIASPAATPTRPRPPGAALLAGAGSSGLLLGWLASLALVRGRGGPRRYAEKATEASLPIVEGLAPLSDDSSVPRASRVRDVERLAGRLLMDLAEAPSPLVAVTSFRAASGTPDLAAALSAALSRRGRRVLLIDPTADAALARRLLGPSGLGPGVPEPTFHAVDGEDAYRILPLARLVAPGQPGALQESLLANVLRLVRPHFDIVVLDAPAIAEREPLPALVAACDRVVILDQGNGEGAPWRIASPQSVAAASAA